MVHMTPTTDAQEQPQLTLGHLTAHHIGHTVTFTDGGATYTGTLTAAHHRRDPRAQRPTAGTTTIALHAGKWTHADTYPSLRACTVEAPMPPAQREQPTQRAETTPDPVQAFAEALVGNPTPRPGPRANGAQIPVPVTTDITVWTTRSTAGPPPHGSRAGR